MATWLQRLTKIYFVYKTATQQRQAWFLLEDSRKHAIVDLSEFLINNNSNLTEIELIYLIILRW